MKNPRKSFNSWIQHKIYFTSNTKFKPKYVHLNNENKIKRIKKIIGKTSKILDKK